MGITYRDSGVDVEGGNRFVKRISPFVKETFSGEVITDIGGFGALFSASFPGMKEPVLVSGTDGVGTKLTIAQACHKHDTIGIDAVAMCVNDIVVSGAKPLFFLDYISCGKLDEDVLTQVVKGIADGCKQSGCSLVGGETAEHPGVMKENDYDIAGFAVGVVDKDKIINGKTITPDDIIIGLPSSGVHSNGFSLVRKLFFDIKKYTIDTVLPGFDRTLGEVLLEPTRLYAKPILSCLDREIPIKGLVHITGGGFYENIPRILPEKTAVKINRTSFKEKQIFTAIQKEGDIPEREMFTTFNMGIGMMVFVSKETADKTLQAFRETGEQAVVIGEVTALSGEHVVIK